MTRKTIPIPARPVSGTVNVDLNDLLITGSLSVDNFTFLAANTEYALTILSSTKYLKLYNRSASRIKYSFAIGTSSTTYGTILPWCFEAFPLLNLSANITVYYQSTLAGSVVEILTGG